MYTENQRNYIPVAGLDDYSIGKRLRRDGTVYNYQSLGVFPSLSADAREAEVKRSPDLHATRESLVPPLILSVNRNRGSGLRSEKCKQDDRLYRTALGG